MKKLFTILLVSFLAVNTSVAQVEGQGTVILGAYTELSNTAWSQAVVTPNIGYFLSDQFVVGLGFSAKSSSSKVEYDVDGDGVDDESITTVVSDMTISPWMRYYTGEMFFIHAAVAIVSGSDAWDLDGDGIIDADGNVNVSYTQDGLTDDSYKSSGFGVAVGAGASILWGDYLAFEPMLGISYGTSSSEADVNAVTTEFTGPTNLNVEFQLGVCVMLGN